MRFLFTFLVVSTFLIACQEPQPRKPIFKSKSKQIQASVERNKRINKRQQEQIQSIVNADSILSFQPAEAGYWFALKRSAPKATQVTAGDEIEFLYRIEKLDGTIIYDEIELGLVNYLVDKEDLLPALRYGVKELRATEIGVFLMPSFLGYGYQGDEDKIEINQPLRFTIEIKKIKKKPSL